MLEPELQIGLRFRKGQAKVIEAIAQELRSTPAAVNATEAIGLFDKAAEAARSGEPLIVKCRRPEEAQQMADDFVLYGLARPAVEDLGVVA